MSYSARQEPPPAGPGSLIDTLQAGFDTINHNLWLLALPIAIDLFFWWGPQLTVGTLIDSWLERVLPTQALGDLFTRAVGDGALLPGGSPDSTSFDRYNLFWLLSVPLLGIPSFRAGATGLGPVISVGSLPAGAVAMAAILLLGLASATLFYGLLAQAVRSGSSTPGAFATEFAHLWVKVLALFGVAGAAFAGVGISIALLLRGVDAMAPAAVTVVASALLGMLLWAFVYLFFTTDALYISLVGPISALKCSAWLVRHNFWSALGLIGLVLVISTGFGVVLHELAKGFAVAGTAIAMIGHIYISSGLAAASMTYYKERFDRLLTTAR